MIKIYLLSFMLCLVVSLGYAQITYIPQDQYTTTAIGNTFIDASGGAMSTELNGAAVNSDGRIFTINEGDEGQRKAGIYENGGFGGTGNVGPLGNPEPIGGHYIAVNKENVFAQAGNAVHSYDFDGRVRTGIIQTGIEIGGLAASQRFLIVTKKDGNEVHVFDLFTQKLLRKISVEGASAVAIDDANEIYVMVTASPAYKVLKYSIDGTLIHEAITLPQGVHPSCMTIDNQGRIMVGDTAVTNQIHFYDVSRTPGLLVESFGQYGSLEPGTPYDYHQLLNITGCGTDRDGNRYVIMEENGSFIRKFTPRGEFVWEMHNTLFIDNGGFDPASDGRDYYTGNEHFVIDYSKKSGSDYKLAHITGREDGSFASIIVRRVDGRLLHYKTGMFGNNYAVYRYDGYKYVYTGYTSPHRSYEAYVDKDGTIWDSGGETDFYYKNEITGWTPEGNPVFTRSATTYPRPSIILHHYESGRLLYDPDTDMMIVFGYTAEHPDEGGWGQPGSEMVRYDNWSTTRTQVWRKVIQNNYQGTLEVPQAVAFAGDYLFLAGGQYMGNHLNTSTWVYKLSDASLVGLMIPQDNVGGLAATGWQDMTWTMDAIKRSNGEYVIALEEGFYGRNILFRWRPEPDTKEKPGATAGIDKSIKLPVDSVTLQGEGSDFDGTITSYAWTKLAGGAASLSGTSTSTLKADNMVPGTYTFRLLVTDNDGFTDADTVRVTVLPPNTANQLPMADAGSDLERTLPDSQITLNGKGTDSDGKIAIYKWAKLEGPAIALPDLNQPDLPLQNLVAGSYKFLLTVTDDDGASVTDTVILTVNAPFDTQAPSAPTNLAFVELRVNDITLSWNAATDNIALAGYEVYERIGAKDNLVARVGPTLTTCKLLQTLPNRAYVLFVKAVDGSNNRSEASNILTGTSPKIPGVAAIKTAMAPVIDGDIDAAWNNAQSYPLSKGFINSNIDNEEDCKVSYRMLWDADSLYILVEYMDPTPQTNAAFPWESDGVEFFFDTNDDKDPTPAAQKDNYQFGYAYGHNIYGTNADHVQQNINFKTIKVEGVGYRIETAIPWATAMFWDHELGQTRTDMPTIQPGLTLGFEVSANDADAGQYRESTILYYAEVEGTWWDAANRWGVIELVEKQKQTLSFTSTPEAIANVEKTLTAISTSGLPVKFEILYGDATLPVSSNILTPHKPGDRLIVRAYQPGNETTARAEAIQWICVGSDEPLVDIVSPADNDVVTIGSNISIDAADINGCGGVATTRVEFFANGEKIGEDSSAPFVHTYVNPPIGAYQFVVKAYAASGDAAADTVENVTVQPIGNGIMYAQYDNISGTAVSDLTSNANFPFNPSSTRLITDVFEGPLDIADDYGAWYRGHLKAPQTGEYTFWIAGDDNCELWLSTDLDSANSVRLAFVPEWTNSREWEKFSEQKSAPVTLTEGQAYYIQVLFKEGGGGDNLAVKWTLPDGTSEEPLAASHISPIGLEDVFRLYEPFEGSSHHIDKPLIMNTTVSDSDGSVTHVDFYVNGVKVGSDNSLPFAYAWSAPAEGTYTVMAKAMNDGVEISSQQVSVTIIPAAVTAIESSLNEASVKVYPVPAQDKLSIELTQAKGATIQIVNMQGMVMLEKAVARTAEINVSKLPQGVYLLRVRDPHGMVVKRIIKL